MTVLPVPLKCGRCERSFLAPVRAKLLDELQEAGITPDEVAAMIGKGQLSEALICEGCSASRNN